MPFNMKAGDTKRIVMTITEADRVTRVDLTEATVRWWASKGTVEQFSRTAILKKTMGSGIEDVALIDGEFMVTLDPADTAGLNGTYYYEVEITDAFGNVSTPIFDTFTVSKDLIV